MLSMSIINPEISIKPSKLLEYPVVVPTEKWIRIFVNDQLLADSTSPLLLIDKSGHSTNYFFPSVSVKKEFLELSDYKGENITQQYWNITVNDTKIANGAYSYTENAGGEYTKLMGYIGFTRKAISKILEENEELIGNPRNPFHRIDTRPTTRLVQYKIGDTIIAESTKSVVLFETSLRARYYVPQEDVKMDLLVKSPTTTICPYKGISSYWSIKLNEQEYKDLAWSYLEPLEESILIKGYICFWNVDLYINGEFKGKY